MQALISLAVAGLLFFLHMLYDMHPKKNKNSHVTYIYLFTCMTYVWICTYMTYIHRSCRCWVVLSCRCWLVFRGLFCRISSLLKGSFAKETYNFKEPTFLQPAHRRRLSACLMTCIQKRNTFVFDLNIHIYTFIHFHTCHMYKHVMQVLISFAVAGLRRLSAHILWHSPQKKHIYIGLEYTYLHRYTFDSNIHIYTGIHFHTRDVCMHTSCRCWSVLLLGAC